MVGEFLSRWSSYFVPCFLLGILFSFMSANRLQLLYFFLWKRSSEGVKAKNKFLSITSLERKSWLSLRSYLPPYLTINSIPKMEEVLPSVELKFLLLSFRYGPHSFGKEGLPSQPSRNSVLSSYSSSINNSSCPSQRERFKEGIVQLWSGKADYR